MHNSSFRPVGQALGNLFPGGRCSLNAAESLTVLLLLFTFDILGVLKCLKEILIFCSILNHGSRCGGVSSQAALFFEDGK